MVQDTINQSKNIQINCMLGLSAAGPFWTGGSCMCKPSTDKPGGSHDDMPAVCRTVDS